MYDTTEKCPGAPPIMSCLSASMSQYKLSQAGVCCDSVPPPWLGSWRTDIAIVHGTVHGAHSLKNTSSVARFIKRG